MNNLEIEIEKQHALIGKFRKVWEDNDDFFCEELVVKKWFYEVSIFIMYHFYTEEYFITTENDADIIHRASHRQLLTQIFSIFLYEGALSKLKANITKFFDKYLDGHMHLFDSKIKYDFSNEKADYFKPDHFHGGFIVLAFRKGYYAIAFGTLTERIASEYLLDLSRFEDNWYKFVDLSRWQFQTQGAVSPSRDVNVYEAENRRGDSYFIVRDDKISQFSVEQFIPEDQKNVKYIGLKDLFENEDLVDLLTSDVLEVLVIASKSYINEYFEAFLSNRLL